jgi:hypothetical protein
MLKLKEVRENICIYIYIKQGEREERIERKRGWKRMEKLETKFNYMKQLCERV